MKEAEFAKHLSDPEWRLSHLYKIMSKNSDIITFVPNEAQKKLIDALWTRNIILKARQRGFCLHPSTRVLTAELKWVEIGSINPGMRLVAVDEDIPGGRGASRKMRTAIVEATATVRGNAYRVVFDDGREVVCTGGHRWLTRPSDSVCQAEWRSIENGNKKKIRTGTLIRWVTKPWGESTFEDGWVGGMLDGEGSMSKKNTAASINVSQVVGPAFAKFEMYLSSRGYNYRTEEDNAERRSKFGSFPVPKLVVSRMDEMFRIIGQTRPIRFLGNEFWDGRDLPGKKSGTGWVKVVSIEPLGEMNMIDLQTSTKTFIAEGFVSHNSTLIQLMMLDTCLFNPNIRAGVIAQDKDAAKVIFRDKIGFAYDRLPEVVREAVPLTTDSKSELVLANNSSLRVGTSMRSGTLQFLHVSEFGKICAKYPDKAREVLTGSLPTVDKDGFVFIESTAEGREGSFFTLCQQSKADRDEGKKLSSMDMRFHFFSWWDADEYQLPPDGVIITSKDHEYFDALEQKIGRKVPIVKRAWYVAKRRTDFGGDDQMMKQEYPSTPDEAFEQSTEGCYYTAQITAARQQGRICTVPHVPGIPVNTFWDIGNSDGSAIWFHQKVGMEQRFIRFYEAWGEPYSHYVHKMQSLGYVWGRHYVPHDADHKRQGINSNKSPKQMLEELGLRNVEVVARIDNVTHGIQQTRDAFSQVWIDKENCSEGIAHLELYRKEWNDRLGCWKDTPLHNVHSECADAFRQFGQSLAAGEIYSTSNTAPFSRKGGGSWRTT